MPACTQYFIDLVLEVLVPAPLAQRVAALEAALLAARADERLEQPVGQFDRWKAEDRAVSAFEELIELCIANQDIEQSERLRVRICEAGTIAPPHRAWLLKKLNDGFYGNLAYRLEKTSNA